MRYAVEQRMRFIDFLIKHYGRINRSALMDYYGLSMPQASKDISDYMALAPENLVYNAKDKCYIQAATFKPYFN